MSRRRRSKSKQTSPINLKPNQLELPIIDYTAHLFQSYIFEDRIIDAMKEGQLYVEFYNWFKFPIPFNRYIEINEESAIGSIASVNGANGTCIISLHDKIRKEISKYKYSYMVPRAYKNGSEITRFITFDLLCSNIEIKEQKDLELFTKNLSKEKDTNGGEKKP